MAPELDLVSVPTLRTLLLQHYGAAPSRVTLSTKARRGVIPAVLVGRSYAVRRADLPAIARTLGLAPAAPAE